MAHEPAVDEITQLWACVAPWGAEVGELLHVLVADGHCDGVAPPLIQLSHDVTRSTVAARHQYHDAGNSGPQTTRIELDKKLRQAEEAARFTALARQAAERDHAEAAVGYLRRAADELSSLEGSLVR